MKNIRKTVAFTLVLLVNSFFTFSQESLVTDVCVSMSKGSQCGISVKIPGIAKDELVDSWVSTVKSQNQYTIKQRKIGGEFHLESASLKGINSLLSIYVLVYEKSDGAELITFFESPDGFITPEKSETEYRTIKKVLQEFAVSTYEDELKEKLKEEEKLSKKTDRDINKLNRKKDRAIKQLAENRQEIAEITENKIPKIEQAKEEKQKLIEDRKAQKRDLKHEDMKAQAQKLVDEREKEIQKLEREKDKLEKDKVKCEEDARELQREINEYTTTIEQKTEQLNNQQSQIRELNRLLD